jgi:negative regulator of sigma E activity
MSHVTDEQLSAFLDGELPEEQLDLLLARIDRDESHRERLARYALIGECLRGSPVSVGALKVAERVRTAIIAADDLAVAKPEAAASRAWRSWAAAGLAATAAVLAVLVGGSQTLLRMDQPQAAAALAGASRAGTTQDLNLQTITAPDRYRLDPRAAARLTGYLMAHGEFASRLSRSNLDSHLVAARAERASWSQARDPDDVR